MRHERFVRWNQRRSTRVRLRRPGKKHPTPLLALSWRRCLVACGHWLGRLRLRRRCLLAPVQRLRRL